MTFNDTEFLIIQAMAMRLSENDALRWLASHGKPLKRAQYYRLKGAIVTSREKWKTVVATKGLWLDLQNRIEQYETIIWMSFQNVLKEKDPLRNQKILESIVCMMPYITNAYESALLLMEEEGSKKKTESDPTPCYFERFGSH